MRRKTWLLAVVGVVVIGLGFLALTVAAAARAKATKRQQIDQQIAVAKRLHAQLETNYDAQTPPETRSYFRAAHERHLRRLDLEKIAIDRELTGLEQAELRLLLDREAQDKVRLDADSAELDERAKGSPK